MMQFSLLKLRESNPKILGVSEHLPTDPSNSLLLSSHNLQTWHYVLIAVFWVMAIGIVGMLSPKIEHVIIFAIALSVIIGAILLAI